MLNSLYNQRAETGNLLLKSRDGSEFKCHKDILTTQSQYFEGMFEFNDNMGEPVTLDYSKELINVMLEFVYLGTSSINSTLLIDLLDMST